MKEVVPRDGSFPSPKSIINAGHIQGLSEACHHSLNGESELFTVNMRVFNTQRRGQFHRG